MIRHLRLTDVGPARALAFSFAPRLNVLTGDNGLGKTFVLDALWWVLTTTWAGEKAFPFRPAPNAADEPMDPKISAVLAQDAGAPGEVVTGGAWRWESQEWARNGPDATDEALPPSLVIYARIDGSYAVFDAHYVKGGITSFADAAIILSPAELWDGKEVADAEVQGGKRTVIGGLIADWVRWQQRAKSPEFEALCEVLRLLSSSDEPLIPSEPSRVHLRDRRDIPTLATSYGVVPVTLASAGMKRVLSLAYLLVWAWAEHEKAAQTSRRKPTRDVVLLIDEPELHQHPAWQRTFLPAVLKAVGTVAPNAAVQVFTATHAPLVLASLESAWSEAIDDLFVLERDGSVIRANPLMFVRQGDVTSWLASTVFGGVSGRSRAAELATDAAQHFMADRAREAEDTLRLFYDHVRGQLSGQPLLVREFAWLLDPPKRLAERIHDALKYALPGHDEFWVHWTLIYRPPAERGDAAR